MYQSGHWSLLNIESFEDLLVPCFWWYCNSSMELVHASLILNKESQYWPFATSTPANKLPAGSAAKQINNWDFPAMPNCQIIQSLLFSGSVEHDTVKGSPESLEDISCSTYFMQLLEDLVGFLCDCQCFSSTHLVKLSSVTKLEMPAKKQDSWWTNTTAPRIFVTTLQINREEGLLPIKFIRNLWIKIYFPIKRNTIWGGFSLVLSYKLKQTDPPSQASRSWFIRSSMAWSFVLRTFLCAHWVFG